jgi:hypothetical protein
MTGITATPYKKFWELMHECGYHELDIVGTLPAADDYRTFRDHNLQYTDGITIKSPASHFKYLLENPGKEMARMKQGDEEKIFSIPDLRTNTGSILFVPGESARKTHQAICKIALENGKNCLVINGKTKAFFKPGMSEMGKGIDIRTYRKEKLKELAFKIAHLASRGESTRDVELERKTLENLPSMDLAVAMYNSPELNLKDTDLVITGFYCVERGVTINRPNFQFRYMILSPYHYKEGSSEIESIIQISGRSFGNKEWVPAGITILSPKYILDEVQTQIDNFIKFLHEKPQSIQYADIYRETNGIPILFKVNDSELLDKLRQMDRMTDKTKPKFMKLFMDGVNSGKITMDDPNHGDKHREPFSLQHYSFEGKRYLQEESKAKNYRFPQFYEHYIKRKVYGQSVVEKGGFTIDLTFIPITMEDDKVLEAGTGFISFAYIPRRPVADEEE